MKNWLTLIGILFAIICCDLCIGGDILLQGSSLWGLEVISGNVEIIGPTNTDFISVAKQADGNYGPGGTASVKENINTSQGINITIYRLYNGTGLAYNLSSVPINPSDPRSSTEPLINPLLVALNDSNSDIRDRADKALDDIKSSETADPLIQENTSTSSLPTYSQILSTYPEGTEVYYPSGTQICSTEGHIIGVTDKGWNLNMTSLQISNGDAVVQCYGAKMTLDVPITIDGKTFDAGSKLTVDKDLNWVEVSSWD